ncbi:MAG: histidine phosphatase family protein, partial [Actinomycetota bacterium]
MSAGTIILLRHGETEWSKSGRHTGLSDIPLTAAGEERAASLRDRLADTAPALILCSPLQRARRTAELAGLWPAEIDDDLLEWDYGAWEGRTTADIRAELNDPEWTVWKSPIPPGSTSGEQPE